MPEIQNPIVLFSLILVATLLVVFLLYKGFSPAGKVSKRVREHSSVADKKNPLFRKTQLLESEGKETKYEGFFKTLGTDPKSYRNKLKQADSGMTVSEFILLQFGIIAVVIIAGLLLTKLLWWIPVLVGILLGYALPRFWLNKRIEKRIKKFNKIFPDALELMVRGLRTGLPITECIKVVARDAAHPVGTEFARMRDDIKLGMSLSETVWKAADRLQTQEYNFFAVAISIQLETGGNLAENLEKLADILRKRLQIYRMIDAKSSEARWTGRVLGALPFIMFGLITAVAPDYTAIFFKDTRAMILAGIGITWLSIGILWMRSMTRFDF